MRSGPAAALTLAAPAICNFLSASRPLSLLLFGSVMVSLVYSLWLPTLDFTLGTSAVWMNARGVIDGSWADISTALSGYYYFMHDSWHLPLFTVSKLGAPAGVSVIYTDSIPVVSLIGRILYRCTGEQANPYGIWLGVCLIGAAVGNTWLVARLGARSIAAAIAATVCGLCMPTLLFRWGHMSLMGQFEIVLALTFYAIQRRADRVLSFIPWPALLFVLALWTHVYLFVMVFLVVAAAPAQALLERRLTPSGVAVIFAAWIDVVIVTLKVSGHLTGASPFEGSFGIYSMNTLSAITPPEGSLFAVRFARADATGGQYEGFNYLGAGVLVMAGAALYWNRRKFREIVCAHACLLLVLAGLTAFALSNEIFVGPWRAAKIPLPLPILVLCGFFRSSGRFFWPAAYLVGAASIAAVAGRRHGTALLLIAAGLQWFDTASLRVALAQSTSRAAPVPFDQPLWQHAISRHGFVRVLPSYACLPKGRNWMREFALQIQLLTAREDVATNTVYAARHMPDCTGELLAGPLPSSELRIYFVSGFDRLGPESDRVETDPRSCYSSERIVLCSKLLDGSEAQRVLSAISQR